MTMTQSWRHITPSRCLHSTRAPVQSLRCCLSPRRAVTACHTHREVRPSAIQHRRVTAVVLEPLQPMLHDACRNLIRSWWSELIWEPQPQLLQCVSSFVSLTNTSTSQDMLIVYHRQVSDSSVLTEIYRPKSSGHQAGRCSKHAAFCCCIPVRWQDIDRQSSSTVPLHHLFP